MIYYIMIIIVNECIYTFADKISKITKPHRKEYNMSPHTNNHGVNVDAKNITRFLRNRWGKK